MIPLSKNSTKNSSPYRGLLQCDKHVCISVRLPERFGISALHLRHTTQCVLQRVLSPPVPCDVSGGLIGYLVVICIVYTQNVESQQEK